MLSALTAHGKPAHHANPPLLISREWRPSIQQSATKNPRRAVIDYSWERKRNRY